MKQIVHLMLMSLMTATCYGHTVKFTVIKKGAALSESGVTVKHPRGEMKISDEENIDLDGKVKLTIVATEGGKASKAKSDKEKKPTFKVTGKGQVLITLKKDADKNTFIYSVVPTGGVAAA